MSAQRGRDLLLKIEADGGFVTLAGMRARRIVFDAQLVDTTDSESAGHWRELLAQAGVRRASIRGGGIFRDAPSDERIRKAFFLAEMPIWQIVMPDFGVLEGRFQIATLEYRGSFQGEIGFELVLESAGPISFEAL